MDVTPAPGTVARAMLGMDTKGPHQWLMYTADTVDRAPADYTFRVWLPNQQQRQVGGPGAQEKRVDRPACPLW